MAESSVGATDKLLISVVRNHPHVPSSVKDKLSTWQAKSRLAKAVIATLPHLPPDLSHELLDRIMASAVIESALHLHLHRADGSQEPLGVVDTRVITTAGVVYLCGVGKPISDFNFHGLGTGTTAPAVGDTALGTEYAGTNFSTSYRASGTQSESASGNNEVYQTVATNTANTTIAPTELGVFTAASAGTLLDRFTFAVVNLASGDSLSSTIQVTVNSGG